MRASDLWEAVLLGALQGLTEFLPISSSGHLYAVERLIGSRHAESFILDVFVHTGTLLAVLIVLRRPLVVLLRDAVSGGPGRREAGAILICCLPAAVVGGLFGDRIEAAVRQFALLVPLCWLFTAAALFTLRWERFRGGGRSIGGLDALWVGLWQVLALLPGVSRSGITISAALWRGCDRERAATFSFLVSIPLVLGATVREAARLGSDGGAPAGMLVPCVAAAAVAAATGWAALELLLRMVRRGVLHLWSYYLVTAALAFSAWIARAGSG